MLVGASNTSPSDNVILARAPCATYCRPRMVEPSVSSTTMPEIRRDGADFCRAEIERSRSVSSDTRLSAASIVSRSAVSSTKGPTSV